MWERLLEGIFRVEKREDPFEDLFSFFMNLCTSDIRDQRVPKEEAERDFPAAETLLFRAHAEKSLM